MKKILTLAMMLLCVGSMMANWQPSDTEAIRLDVEGSIAYGGMKTIRTDDGKIILSWLCLVVVDGENNYRLHLQIFDAQGNRMFGDEGIIVCDKHSRSWATDYGLALAPNGDILLSYTDIRNDPSGMHSEVYMYRYTQQGEPVWNVDGVLFPSELIHENALSYEDTAPIICVSGNNIYAVVDHSEKYMEKANEDNWTPTPWNPNMPDSVLLTDSRWLIKRINDDGSIASENTKDIASKIIVIEPADGGNAYLVYDNKDHGLSGQLINASLENVWGDPVVIEERPITTGLYVATPLAQVNDYGILMLTYRVLTDFYGFQVANFLAPDGRSADDPVSLAGDIDGDAGGAAMGVKEDRAMVAWEYAYSASEKRMNVNVVDDNNWYYWEDEKMYGFTLETNTNWGYGPVAVIPASDGWVLLYGCRTYWDTANFMVVKIDDDGEVLWTKQICEENFKSSGFSVVYDSKNAYIFYTQDRENKANDGGMYVMCVDISGKVDAINELPTGDEVLSTEIYTIDGRRISSMEKGVNIVRTTYKSGKSTTTKVMR